MASDSQSRGAAADSDGERGSSEEEEATTASEGSDAEKMEQAANIRKGFKSPKCWMLVVGTILACCAGAVNVIAFEELNGTFVSHLTGSLSKTAMELEGVHDVKRFDPQSSLEHLLLIVSFVFGAFLCGLVIDRNTVHFGGHSFYGVALIGNCALLCGATGLTPHRGAAYLAAMACGLQNAMCTSHFTAVVRTTHVTGSFTDIGSTAGRIVAILLRRNCCGRRMRYVDKAEIWVDGTKLQILSMLACGFFLGSFVGAYLHAAIGAYAWLLPAGVTGAMGLAYSMLNVTMKEIVRRYEQKQMQEEVMEVEDHIERAARMLHSWRRRSSVESTQAVASTNSIIEMESEIEHCLDIVREFSRMSLDVAGQEREDHHGKVSVN